MTPPVRRVADIRYGEVLGYRPLELDLYLPEGSEVPVVVYVHGGGWQRGSRRDPPPLLEADFYDQIAAQGLAVAAVDYRLSGEARFPAPLEDVCAAVGWIRRPCRRLRAGRGPGVSVGRLGRRPSRAADRADRARGAGCGGLVPGHRPGGHAVRPGGRGRRARSGAGLP